MESLKLIQSHIFLLTLLFLSFETFGASTEVVEIQNFGENPGNLKMYQYIASKNSQNLVVVLHGCTQSVENFDHESGWIQVANEKKANLIFAEQASQNNSLRCFNWFQTSDNSRDNGELYSIYNMIQFFKSNSKAKNIYITGLSAGAIMANSMVATYPGLFKGAIIAAGVYHGCANNSIDAFSCMYGYKPTPSDEKLKNYVLKASDNYTEAWPKIVIVQGLSDSTVNPKNAELLSLQWSKVHGLNLSKALTKEISHKVSITTYRDNQGSKKVFKVLIKDMGHGYPIDSKSSCGEAGEYILDVEYCLASEAINLLNSH